MSEQLLEIHPREIKFIFEVKKQSSCSVRLANKSNNHVAFKVKTTSPKKYCVRPNTGLIKPKSTYDFVVRMQAQRLAPPDMICTDKFLVQSTVVPAATTDVDITPSMFANDDSRCVEEIKLRVILVRPPDAEIQSQIIKTFKEVITYEDSMLKDQVLRKVESPIDNFTHKAPEEVEEYEMENNEDRFAKDVDYKTVKDVEEPAKDMDCKTVKDVEEPAKNVEYNTIKDIEEPANDVEYNTIRDIKEPAKHVEYNTIKDVEDPAKVVENEKMKDTEEPPNDVEHEIMKDVEEHANDVEHKTKKDVEGLKFVEDIEEPAKNVEYNTIKDIEVPAKDVEYNTIRDIKEPAKHVEYNTIKDVEDPAKVVENEKMKDTEEPPNDVEHEIMKDVEEHANDVEHKTKKDVEGLKFVEDIADLKSRLNEIESKINEASITISKLTGERD